MSLRWRAPLTVSGENTQLWIACIATSSNTPLGFEPTTSTLVVLPSTFTVNCSTTHPLTPFTSTGYLGGGEYTGLGRTSPATTESALSGEAPANRFDVAAFDPPKANCFGGASFSFSPGRCADLRADSSAVRSPGSPASSGATAVSCLRRESAFGSAGAVSAFFVSSSINRACSADTCAAFCKRVTAASASPLCAQLPQDRR